MPGGSFILTTQHISKEKNSDVAVITDHSYSKPFNSPSQQYLIFKLNLENCTLRAIEFNDVIFSEETTIEVLNSLEKNESITSIKFSNCTFKGKASNYLVTNKDNNRIVFDQCACVLVYSSDKNTIPEKPATPVPNNDYLHDNDFIDYHYIHHHQLDLVPLNKRDDAYYKTLCNVLYQLVTAENNPLSGMPFDQLENDKYTLKCLNAFLAIKDKDPNDYATLQHILSCHANKNSGYYTAILDFLNNPTDTDLSFVIRLLHGHLSEKKRIAFIQFFEFILENCTKANFYFPNIQYQLTQDLFDKIQSELHQLKEIDHFLKPYPKNISFEQQAKQKIEELERKVEEQEKQKHFLLKQNEEISARVDYFSKLTLSKPTSIETKKVRKKAASKKKEEEPKETSYIKFNFYKKSKKQKEATQSITNQLKK